MIETAATVAESRLACAIKLCRVHYLRCVRFLTATVVAAAIALAGCAPGGTPTANNRHMQPLSERMLAELEAQEHGEGIFDLGAHFKEEAELEVSDSSGPRSSKATARISAISGIT
jgi:hypothetical protein